MHKIYPQSDPGLGHSQWRHCGWHFVRMWFTDSGQFWMNLIIIIGNILNIQCLGCDEVLEKPANYTLSLRELESISPKDIIECLAHLSKEPLPAANADFIWNSIVRHFDGVQSIPEKVLMILHYVTVAVKPEDYANLTLSSIDVIENFGLDYNLQNAQLSAIADRVREDFSGKQPEDYTFYDLIALKQILCQFNRSEIERIHPSAYREAALTIGKLNSCGAGAMAGFATLAVQDEAFGPPARWTTTIVDILGKVAEFIPAKVIHRITKAENKQQNGNKGK